MHPLYQQRLCSASEAVSGIRSGDRVLVGSGCAHPELLVDAMVKLAGELSDVEVTHLLTLGRADYIRPEYQAAFRHNAFFIGGNVRNAVQSGLADYTPIFLHELPSLLRSSRKVDVALLQLSPPDKHGFCSLGIHVDIQRAAIDAARMVIAELNPNMPRTFGDTPVHLSQLSAVVESCGPILELKTTDQERDNDVSMRIGCLVARLIPDGACVQLGIGRIPDAVLQFLQDKNDLGVHTEMFSDGLLRLLNEGNITNSRKTIHPHKTVTSFVMGSRALYDYVDDNPTIAFYASDFVNDPRIVSQNDDVVAVNSAIQVDLTGQVTADSIGHRFYSGIGGQVDFIRGAAMSRRGKPIIALPSTAKNGTVSRIVPKLSEGTGVVTSRGDVHYVVTEFGVAYLHGKTIRERAFSLINVAHPKFRTMLLDRLKETNYAKSKEAIDKQLVHAYPSEWEDYPIYGGERFFVRPLQAADERRLQEFFYSHEPETIYSRYFSVKKSLGHWEAAELCCVDWRDRMAFGVFEDDEAESLVAVGRYDRAPRENRAEVALTVHEKHRRKGVAKDLFRRLEAYAKQQNIKGLHGQIHPSNDAMLSLHRRLGHDLTRDSSGFYVWQSDLCNS